MIFHLAVSGLSKARRVTAYRQKHPSLLFSAGDRFAAGKGLATQIAFRLFFCHLIMLLHHIRGKIQRQRMRRLEAVLFVRPQMQAGPDDFQAL